MAGHTAVTLRLLKLKLQLKATNELPNMSLDSEVIETEAPKNDMITVDLKTQDTKQNYKTKALKMS